MRRRRLEKLTSILLRGRAQRIAFALLAFAIVNLAYSVIGEWSLSFGGVCVEYAGNGRAQRTSGIFSCRGYLVIARRETFQMAGGMRRHDEPPQLPVRTTFPWSISSGCHIGPGMLRWLNTNGILDGWPHTLAPGLKLALRDPSRGEWYNNGVAIHWSIITAFAALPILQAFVRPRRHVYRGRCIICGYDLRATPDRCPECGTPPDVKAGDVAAHHLGRYMSRYDVIGVLKGTEIPARIVVTADSESEAEFQGVTHGIDVERIELVHQGEGELRNIDALRAAILQELADAPANVLPYRPKLPLRALPDLATEAQWARGLATGLYWVAGTVAASGVIAFCSLTRNPAAGCLILMLGIVSAVLIAGMASLLRMTAVIGLMMPGIGPVTSPPMSK